MPKLTAQQTQDLNIGACKILMARLQAAIDAKAAIENPHYGHAGDTRAIAEQLAALVRQADGYAVEGDDYGREILAGLGLK